MKPKNIPEPTIDIPDHDNGLYATDGRAVWKINLNARYELPPLAEEPTEEPQEEPQEEPLLEIPPDDGAVYVIFGGKLRRR